ncbi:MAG: TonB-dependent receptor [Alphaproteobacteria bacterium]|nr:TonB-dependent receptor [Alphaproteobacteria bacterium]
MIQKYIVVFLCLSLYFGLNSQKYSKHPVFFDTTILKINQIERIEIKSIRITKKTPFVSSDIQTSNLKVVNTGIDLPISLQNTPNLISFSDAGNGVGYTGFRIRGSDATRINVTINGIPFNDPESMQTYFVNIPDIISSAQSIQVQRGVGPSTNGASSFGGSVNIATNGIDTFQSYQLMNAASSFNTFKNTLVINVPTLNKKLIFNLRASNIISDGYIDNATSSLQSLFFKTAYQFKKSNLIFNIFTGKERTYQAWYGVPQDSLKTHRTFNPAGLSSSGTRYPNQIDLYNQTHFQLFYNLNIDAHNQLNLSAFNILGKGYYEEFIENPNPLDYGIATAVILQSLVRQRWLDNNYKGLNANYITTFGNHELTFGTSISSYQGNHFGKVITLNSSPINLPNYYFNNAEKNEFQGFAKWQYKILNNLLSYLDYQFRYINYTINGFEIAPDLVLKNTYFFQTPKIGLVYLVRNFRVYTSFSTAQKEPNRQDFETDIAQQPKPEQLYDFELGFMYTLPNFNFGLNFYNMDYKNQLVLTGKINDIGAYTRTNVPVSYRRGLEWEGAWAFHKNFKFSWNGAVSINKIKRFATYTDNYDSPFIQIENNYQNTDIAFSPNFIQQFQLQYQYKTLQTTLMNRYYGRQYLDNTQDIEKSLAAFSVIDFNIAYNLKISKKIHLYLAVLINNVLDTYYEPNGYTFSYYAGGTLTKSNFYYPMAGRNYSLQCNFQFNP